MKYTNNAFDAINTIAPIFGNLVNDMIQTANSVNELQKFKTPATNIIETEQSFELHIAVPGFGKEDIKLNIEGDTLEVIAQKAESNDIKSDKYLRKEFGNAGYKRVFNLSVKIDKSKIGASYNNGILVVTLSKKDNVSFNVNID